MANYEEQMEIYYYVVVNEEGQYSIWRVDKAIPNGWKSVGERDTKSQCLDFIKETWTDMRPLSLQRDMVLEKN